MRYDPASESSLTGAVVDAIATAADIDPIDLPPLNESIDPDALERLFEGSGEAEDMLVIGFAVDEWNVFVRGDGHIRVCDPSEQADATPLHGTTNAVRTD